MKRHYRIGASILLGLLAITALSLSGCSKPKQPGGETDKAAAAPWSSDLGAAYPVVEGLHVTGQPVDIDPQSFRLRVGGAVETPLSLSLSEIRGMKAERRLVTLVCPGFFVDEGHWTGVRISDLLDMAGVKEGATRVEFLAADSSYRATLRLEEIGGEGIQELFFGYGLVLVDALLDSG